MAKGKNSERNRKARAEKLGGSQVDAAMDALDNPPVEADRNGIRPDLAPDRIEESESGVASEFGSDGFRALQKELVDIRIERGKLSKEMAAPDLDHDQRADLKMRLSLLKERETSAREELKLFYKNEISGMGAVNKVRVIVEDYLVVPAKYVEGLL